MLVRDQVISVHLCKLRQLGPIRGNTPTLLAMEADEVNAWELLGYGTSRLHFPVDEEKLGCIVA